MSLRTLGVNGSRLVEQDREQLLTTVRRLLVEAEALSSRIAAVNEIGIAINRTYNLDEILQVVARQAKWLLDFDHCSVCLRLEGLNCRLVTLFGPTLETGAEDWVHQSGIGAVIRSGQSRLIREEDQPHYFKDYASQIIIPLTSGGEVMGTINFFRRQTQAYTQEDMRVGYLLALQLSSAIRNAEHFQEMKEAEAELRRYAGELEARNQELDAYNHTIAHDLKTPISSIMMKTSMIKLLAGEGLPERARYHLDSIDTSVKDMTRMIDQLLLLAKLRDAHEAAVTINVQAAVETVLARFHESLEKERITVEIGSLPPAFGHGQWVEEVFANLIGNAIKYMGSETVQREIRINGSAQGNMMRYDVRDTGVGIAPEDQQRLFEMFTRLHTVKADGLGLGLSIVQRIVTRLGGKVGVESTPGKGSTFWFTLPVSG